MNIIFPSQPYTNLKEVDYNFKEEYDVALLLGFIICLFDFDEMMKRKKLVTTAPKHGSRTRYIYRGWQMKTEDYDEFDCELSEQKNIFLLNDYFDYKDFHLYKFIYNKLTNKFQRSWIFDDYFINGKNDSGNMISDIKISLSNLTNIDNFFIKDFVKSEADILKIENNKFTIEENVYKFIYLRSNSYERGIVLKEWSDDVKEERRYFVYDDKTVISNDFDGLYTQFVQQAAIELRVSVGEPISFYSMDVAKVNGEVKIIEVGDGQVSSLKGIDAKNFYKMLLIQNFN